MTECRDRSCDTVPISDPIRVTNGCSSASSRMAECRDRLCDTVPDNRPQAKRSEPVKSGLENALKSEPGACIIAGVSIACEKLHKDADINADGLEEFRSEEHT